MPGGIRSNPRTGWGSLVNRMLLAAPYAMINGLGFQPSQLVCAAEDAAYSPHCFFQPLSNCGQIVRVEFDRWPLHNYYEVGEEEVVRACHTAATVLGVAAPSCNSSQLQAWRMIARLVLRVQPDVEERIHAVHLRGLPWAGGRFAAMHIRRTDKRIEAKPVAECTYASRLEQLCGDKCSELDVFVATDDLRVIDGVRKCEATARHSWRLRHFESDPGRGNSRAVVYRLYAELTLMSRAEWVVGTFSSNFARVTQLLRWQAEESMASVDDGCIGADKNCPHNKLWHPARR